MTALHITYNPDSNGSIAPLCGAARNQTYGTIADGTADRYIDRAFLGNQHMADPELCRECLAQHDSMPPAGRVFPAIFGK